MEAIISDVGLVDAKGDVLKFICEYSDKIYPNEKTYKEVTVTNLSDPVKRKVSSEFVDAPTFAEINLPAPQLAAK